MSTTCRYLHNRITILKNLGSTLINFYFILGSVKIFQLLGKYLILTTNAVYGFLSIVYINFKSNKNGLGNSILILKVSK